MNSDNPSTLASIEYKPVRTGDYDEEESQKNPLIGDESIYYDDDDDDENGKGFPSEEVMRQQQLERRERQNEMLKMLENTMERLSQMSIHISNEMEAQNHSINALEVENEDIQYDSERLTRDQRRVQRSLFEENYYFCIFFWLTALILLILIAIKAYKDFAE